MIRLPFYEGWRREIVPWQHIHRFEYDRCADGSCFLISRLYYFGSCFLCGSVMTELVSENVAPSGGQWPKWRPILHESSHSLTLLASVRLLFLLMIFMKSFTYPECGTGQCTGEAHGQQECHWAELCWSCDGYQLWKLAETICRIDEELRCFRGRVVTSVIAIDIVDDRL